MLRECSQPVRYFACLLFVNVNPEAQGTVVNESSEKPPASL